MHKIITCLNQGHLEPLKVTHTAKMAIEEKRRENKIEGQSKKGERSKMMREGLTFNRFTENEIKVIF